MSGVRRDFSETLWDPDAPMEVRPGREYPYTSVGNWVILHSDLSHLAFRIYAILRMHCRERTGDRCWPYQSTLASIAGLAKPDRIPAAIAELVAIDAVQVEVGVSTPQGRRNRYTVHEAPPESWTGPTTQKEWAALRESA